MYIHPWAVSHCSFASVKHRLWKCLLALYCIAPAECIKPEKRSKSHDKAHGRFPLIGLIYHEGKHNVMAVTPRTFLMMYVTSVASDGSGSVERQIL